MLELPEVLTMAAQLQENVIGKTVTEVLPPTKNHKFCWYNGDPGDYSDLLEGCKVIGAEGFGLYVELSFEGGHKLCLNDGVNMRLMSADTAPKNYQLMISFDDGMAVVFTVAMYGGIYLHDGRYDNEYYCKSREAVSVFSPEFEAVFMKQMTESKQSLSAKAFLATEQRFPGIGNGVLQDILFAAGIPPRRKIETLGEEEKDRLFQCVVSVLKEMRDLGGRDTEKNLFGIPGGYKTKMSKNTVTQGCPSCGEPIVKEAYLGGSVYYCTVCQPSGFN